MNPKQNIVIAALMVCTFMTACTTELKNDSANEHETRVEEQILQGEINKPQTQPNPENIATPSV